MQIQCKLRLTQLQRDYLKARYEIRGKQRIHGKSLLTRMTFLRMIAPRNKTVAHTFLLSFDNASCRLCQQSLLRSRNFASMHGNVTSHILETSV